MAPPGESRADLFQEVQVGALDESALPIVGWGKAFHVGNPGMPEYWSANEQSYPPEFAQWIEENIAIGRSRWRSLLDNR